MQSASNTRGLSLNKIDLIEREISRWSTYNFELLSKIFTSVRSRLQSFAKKGIFIPELEILEGMNNQIECLESIIDRLELIDNAGLGLAAFAGNRTKVFVVRGHDEGAREGVARFLEKLGLEAIILSEQPNRGRTVIEKFVDYAREVGFAVVLLTPDDLGGAVADEAQSSRARQNVVFELGYFVGSLGRGCACLLRKGEVEIPSDLYGVVYTTMDPGNGWRSELARELKRAGFEFDAEKVWA